MHKNIKKIISLALLSTVISSNTTSIFALSENEALYNSYNQESKNLVKSSENIKYVGPFIIDTSLNLGVIPDAPIDNSYLDDYVKQLVTSYIKPNGESLMLSDVVNIVGFNNMHLLLDDNVLEGKKTNYEWLKYIPNLKEVSLNISPEICDELDIQKLGTLQKLETINLNAMKPNDCQHLKNLNSISVFPVLQELGLNNITNLSNIDFSLSNSLISLDISDTTFADVNTTLATLSKSNTIKLITISDIDNQNTIDSLKNIEKLVVENINTDVNFNGIKNLKELYISGYINLGENNCIDGNAIKDLANLELLCIQSKNPLNINNIESLEALTNLKYLEFNNVNTTINNLNFNVFTNLSSLILNNTELKTLNNIDKLSNLKVLEVLNTKITDLQFSDNTALNNSLLSISIGGSELKLTNLSALKKLVNLTSIFIKDSEIKDVNDIFTLDKIEDITLTDVYGFEDVDIKSSSLKNLDIGYYKNRGNLNNITVLENNNIKDIAICNTNLSDISFMKQLKCLKSFNLSDNPISDITPIVEISNSLENNKSYLNVIFAPKEQLEKIKSKLVDSKYNIYKLAKSKSVQEEFWKIKDTTPVNLKENIGIYCEELDSFISLDNADYKIDFVLDDPRMGYLTEDKKFVATKAGEISGILKIANVDCDNAKIKLTFTSSISENKGSIKVQYIDTDTKKEIANPTYINNLSPGDVTVSAKTIEGYDLIGNSTVVEKIDNSNLDKTVVFEYKKQEKVVGKVTIDYVDDKTGEKIKTSKVEDNLELKEYTFVADKIDGYNVVGESSEKITLTKENSTSNIKFRYSKIENNNTTTPVATTGSITVKYLDNSTKKEIATSTVMSNLELKQHTVESKAIEGYTVVGESKVTVTLNETNKTKEVVFNYTKNTTNNTTEDKDTTTIVLSKDDIKNAIDKKKGVSISAENTTLEIDYNNLVSINKELSDVNLNVKSDKNNLEIRKLMIDNELDVLDIFTVESNLKNLKTPILTSFGRSKLSITNGKKAHLYRVNTKSRSSELEYIGEATVKDNAAYFNVMSNLMDNSSFVITSNKRSTDVAPNNGNNNTNNNTNNSTNNKDEDKTKLPDTSGLFNIIKGLSAFSIFTAIILLRKKKRK